jgi:hypothetical protein
MLTRNATRSLGRGQDQDATVPPGSQENVGFFLETPSPQPSPAIPGSSPGRRGATLLPLAGEGGRARGRPDEGLMSPSRLATARRLWQKPDAFGGDAKRCCSSSVVEHSLGKGEVESSILSCSTSILEQIRDTTQTLADYGCEGETQPVVNRDAIRPVTGITSRRAANERRKRRLAHLRGGQ